MATPDPSTLTKACDALAQQDTALARAYRESGLPTWRTRPAAYETLARIIVGQQISTHAAAAIWSRVEAHFATRLTAPALLDADPEALRALGLSRPKVAHLTSIATAIEGGSLELERLCTSAVDDARAELVAVKGIGPWTAEIFLLSAAGHLDAFPGSDVGLMEAYKQLSGAEDRMDAKSFTRHGEAWRPWRGVAAHLLWAWINAQRAKAARDS